MIEVIKKVELEGGYELKDIPSFKTIKGNLVVFDGVTGWVYLKLNFYNCEIEKIDFINLSEAENNIDSLNCYIEEIFGDELVEASVYSPRAVIVES